LTINYVNFKMILVQDRTEVPDAQRHEGWMLMGTDGVWWVDKSYASFHFLP
jgi:hypothetical protein